MRRWIGLGVLVAAGLTAGCGDTGPKRYRASGTVTFDGRPIPYGEVIFTPDGSKNNSGPQGRAPIEDGKFDTAFTDGLGVGAGPTVVRVNGMTGPGGKTICEYDFPLTLPDADSTHAFDVPKKGEVRRKQGPEI